MKKVSVSIIFIFILNLPVYTFAQDVNDSVLSDLKIESYTNKLNAYMYGLSRFNNFELAAANSDKSIRYNPNENLNLGLGFSYKWLGLGLGFNFGFINDDADLYGETRSVDLQMEIYRKELLYSGNLQYYQGYYWQNPDDFFHNWNTSDSLIVRPDIKTITLGINGTYVFNGDNFSFKAAFQNTERQLESAGSWLLSGRFSIYGVSADSSLVPYVLHELYPNVKDIKGLSAVSLGSAGGYTYTFILDKYYYFNVALMLGLNLQAVSRINLSGENIGGPVNISSNAQFRFAIGCNKPKYFYGFSATIDSYSIRNREESYFSYNYGKIRFFYGRRFDIEKNK